MFSYKFIVTAMLTMTIGLSAATQSHAGEVGLNDLQNAKVAYTVAKQRMMTSRMTKDEREQAEKDRHQNCGAVNIGSVDNQRGARAPREVITVVRGDVINTGRCR